MTAAFAWSASGDGTRGRRPQSSRFFPPRGRFCLVIFFLFGLDFFFFCASAPSIRSEALITAAVVASADDLAAARGQDAVQLDQTFNVPVSTYKKPLNCYIPRREIAIYCVGGADLGSPAVGASRGAVRGGTDRQ